MAFSTINKSTSFQNTKLYVGDGSTQSITGVGFQPDLVWTKGRDDTYSQMWVDAVRGGTKYIYSNSTAIEATSSDAITSFDSDGYSIGSFGTLNDNTQNYVSWNWKGNGSGSANEVGTIDSTVSANTTSGFSIVKYTGTAVAGTVGHGLGVTPKFVIVKILTEPYSWYVGGPVIGATKTMYLEATNAGVTSSVWNDALPTSTVFPVGSANDLNKSGADFIAYCFADVPGFCKGGTYTGYENANGPFVYTGFRPTWIMFKPNASADWTVIDSTRNPTNTVADKTLNPNLNSAEHDGGMDTDFLSNGFKIRNGNTDNNYAGENYYLAFGQPIISNSGVVANAR